jgi:hypothetical protein
MKLVVIWVYAALMGGMGYYMDTRKIIIQPATWTLYGFGSCLGLDLLIYFMARIL